MFPKLKTIHHFSDNECDLAESDQIEADEAERIEGAKRALKSVENLILVDDEFAMVAIKTIVELKNTHSLLAEGRELLEANFKA